MIKVENIGSMLKSLIDYRNARASTPTPGSSPQDDDDSGINASGAGRSLQLLVITHDQRLVDHLYLACRPEYIYGLSKNELGVSKAKKHKRIAEGRPRAGSSGRR